jgi:fido (protein-threonine AMPylation protein)
MDANYLIQTEPDFKTRSYNWKTAIGLQDVDGLSPSPYLIATANANIRGQISLDAAEQRISEYYAQKPAADAAEKRSEEADKVSLHIVSILANRTFKLATTELLSIHKRLFEGVFDFAGETREYNISKKEWVLNGDTVVYDDFHTVKDSVEHDIYKEKSCDYQKLDARTAVEHIAKFVSDLWQIHPFGEGNTRTIAVFTIKYLRAFGYDVTNDTFEKHSRYFRNALVRANYNNYKEGIRSTPVFLNRFFGNLLFGETHALKNRELHINFKPLMPTKAEEEGGFPKP